MRDGLADTRSRAAALIRTGDVLVDDVPVDKPGTRVRDEAAVRLRGPARRFVSRGGEKLAGALADLAVDPKNRHCLDIGASTGGFTDALLQAGAASVAAVDVGYGQLAVSLRSDPRVQVLERTHARELRREQLDHEPELGTVDVSFISLAKLLPQLVEVAPGADWLVMVKPQFEVGRERVGRGGVVRDPALRNEAADRVAALACELGLEPVGRADSRLPGPKGNLEIFLDLRRKSPASGDPAAPR